MEAACTYRFQRDQPAVTRYLLDSDVVSELRKPKPHGAVMAGMKTLRPEQDFSFGSQPWRI
jgi:hypothetical protein